MVLPTKFQEFTAGMTENLIVSSCHSPKIPGPHPPRFNSEDLRGQSRNLPVTTPLLSPGDAGTLRCGPHSEKPQSQSVRAGVEGSSHVMQTKPQWAHWRCTWHTCGGATTTSADESSATACHPAGAATTGLTLPPQLRAATPLPHFSWGSLQTYSCRSDWWQIRSNLACRAGSGAPGCCADI